MKYVMAALMISLISGCATAPETYQTEPVGIKPAGISYVPLPFHNYSGGVFTWPVKGPVINYYETKVNRVFTKGIDIKAPEGTYVRASRAGRVVFCDSNFKGYGSTIIIDHGGGYQTVYAYNSENMVKLGDSVSQNAVIARVGKTGRAKEPSLHFEVRLDGRPQNPLNYLSR